MNRPSKSLCLNQPPCRTYMSWRNVELIRKNYTKIFLVQFERLNNLVMEVFVVVGALQICGDRRVFDIEPYIGVVLVRMRWFRAEVLRFSAVNVEET